MKKILIAVSLVLLCLFITTCRYPSRVYIHYNNPEKPLYIHTGRQSGKHYGKEPLVLKLTRYNRFTYPQTDYISWYHLDKDPYLDKDAHIHTETIMNEDNGLHVNLCKIHFYLDDNAQLVKVETKEPQFLRFCF